MTSQGSIFTANIFIDPSNTNKWKEIIGPVILRLRKEPECLFIEACYDPHNTGHVRVVHGWSKGADWVAKNHVAQHDFQEYLKKTEDMWVKPRVAENFDRIVIGS